MRALIFAGCIGCCLMIAAQVQDIQNGRWWKLSAKPEIVVQNVLIDQLMD